VAPGHCAPPSLITYQGALTDAGGSPADGTYSMTFAMYRTPTGGGAVWTETIASVQVTNGVFTVVLGGTSPIPAGLQNCYFLQVSVGGTPLMPRQRLTSVPYAMEASNAGTLAQHDSAFYRNASNLNAGTVAAGRLPTITGDLLASQTVTGGKLAPGAVTAPKIASDAVTGAKVLDGSLTGDDLADHSISSADLAPDSVTAAELAADAVDAAAIQAGAVDGSKIAVGSSVEGESWASSVFRASNTSTGNVCDGLRGETTGNGAGVSGEGSGTTGKGVYGYSASPTGYGVYARTLYTSAYALYVGGGKAYFEGPATFHGGHSDGDLAENRPSREVEPGDVVAIARDGVLVKCTQAQDPAVAGIISTSPTMNVGGLAADRTAAPLALVGVVPCKVDATKAPIRPGDLLVSSSTPGHAMRCPNDRPKAGTVIGKALEGLGKGTGVIQVLVTLR
jgi:hypothetical protein